MNAIAKRDKTKIKELINRPDPEGFTPLMEAILFEPKPDLSTIELLLENGADVNVRMADGKPFIFVLFEQGKGRIDILKLILEKGNLNPFFTWKNVPYTPLTEAKAHFLTEHAKLLKEYEDKYLAEHLLSVESRESLLRDLDHIEIMDYIKQKGHVLGINGLVLLEGEAKKEEIENIGLEGYKDAQSLEYLSKLVSKYQEDLAKNTERQEVASFWPTIAESYKNLFDYTGLAKTPKEIFDSITNQKEKPILLTAGWTTHTVSIAIYNDFLILSNRGTGRAKEGFGTRIYKFTDEAKKLLTEEFIKSLVGRGEDEATILARINKLLPESAFLEEIESQDQKHGTCSFVNHKSILRPILYLMERKKLATVQGKSEQDKTIIEDAKKFAKTEYKRFTGWMRDREVDDLIVQYKNGRISKPVLEQIIRAYITTHFKQSSLTKNPEKKSADVERVFKLLSILDEDSSKAMLDSLVASTHTLYEAAKAVKNTKTADLIKKYRKPSKERDLVQAMIKNKFADMESLINQGANPNFQFAIGSSCFIAMLVRKAPISLIKAMIVHGADLHSKLYTEINAIPAVHLAAAGDDANEEVLKLLRDSGLDLNEEDAHGVAAINKSCRNGRIESVKALLKLGADPNHIAKLTLSTPLMDAIFAKNAELIKILLDNGAKVDFINNAGNSPLLAAIDMNDPNLVTVLINKGADVNCRTKGNDTLFMLIAKIPDLNLEIAGILLAKGVPLDARNSKNQTALDIAIQMKNTKLEKFLKNAQDVIDRKLADAFIRKNQSDMESLLKIGANPNFKLVAGTTVFLEAIDAGMSAHIIKKMIDHGANVKDKHYWKGRGRPAMHLAVFNKESSEIIELLSKKGADVNEEDDKGVTALNKACQNGKLESVKTLLKLGADPNHIAKVGLSSPLIDAMSTGNIEIIELLLKKGVTVNQVDEQGESALTWSIDNNNPKIVEMLLANGADAKHVTKNQETALTLLANMPAGNVEIAKMLLLQGAPLNAKNNKGETALDIAIKSKNSSLVEFLRAAEKEPVIFSRQSKTPIKDESSKAETRERESPKGSKP